MPKTTRPSRPKESPEAFVPAFPDKTRPPTDDEFARVLGKSATHWRALEDDLSKRHGPLTFEWKHYGARSGWTRKVLRGTRNLCFISAREGHFVAAFVMGEAAVAAVVASALPRDIVDALVGARRYAEGRGVRVEVRTRTDAAHVATLVDIKIAH